MQTNIQEPIRTILQERFGRDNLIALATTDRGKPEVRLVNGYYNDSAFFVITHTQSKKMRQIARDPHVAIAREWFTAHGIGENLGWFGQDSNREIAKTLRSVFRDWIDSGHTRFEDRGTCILRIRLTDGILFSHGTRYDIVFS